MTRTKRILTISMVVILACGLFIGAGVTTCAYERLSYTHIVKPTEFFLTYYSFADGSFGVVNADRSGVATFQNSVESSGPYLIRSCFQTQLNFFTDYGIEDVLSIELSFLFTVSQFDDQSFGVESFVFYFKGAQYDYSSSEVSNFVIFKDSTNPESYEVTVSFDFDTTGLSLNSGDFIRFDLIGNNAALSYNNETGYLVSIDFHSAYLYIDYTAKTSGDVANEKLDDVNKNLDNIKDSLQNNQAAQDFKSDWNAYFDKNPVNSWGSVPQFNLISFMSLVGSAKSEISFLWSPFIANTYVINILGIEFDPVKLYIDLLLYTSMIVMMLQLIRGVRK